MINDNERQESMAKIAALNERLKQGHLQWTDWHAQAEPILRALNPDLHRHAAATLPSLARQSPNPEVPEAAAAR